jgi:mannosylglycoprotein endo-beta-mannosidase
LWDGFADGQGASRPGSAQFWDGPYGPQDPRVFFDPDFYPFAFNPEVGSVGLPVEATIRRALPGTLSAIPDFVCVTNAAGELVVEERPSAAYQHHCYMSYGDPAGGVSNQIAVYGVPATLEAFCLQAQLANYVQYRALVRPACTPAPSMCSAVLVRPACTPAGFCACRILRRVSESLACGAQHMALEAFAPGSASERTGCAFPALAIARAALRLGEA